MSRIAYVNGKFVPQRHAYVAMEDRGYQFADGMYEVAAFIGGALLDAERHLDRMEYSLAELGIPMPASRASIRLLIAELIAQNSRRSGLVYIQVTRGVAPRNHAPNAALRPVLSLSVLPVSIASDAARAKGAKAVTAPDMRWKRCDIKSIALLPNVMARGVSVSAGVRETIMVNAQGEVTEGSATNIFFVRPDGAIQTHPKDTHILGGITREVVIELAHAAGIAVVERPYAAADIPKAAEVFFTSTSAFVMPLTHIDDIRIGDGKPGPVTQRLIALYHAHVAKETA
jgi:D-alanine transaminase